MPGDWRRRIVRVSVDNNFSTGILDQASGNLAPGSSREWSIALTEPHDRPFCAIDPDRIAFSSTLGHVLAAVCWDILAGETVRISGNHADLIKRCDHGGNKVVTCSAVRLHVKRQVEDPARGVARYRHSKEGCEQRS
jgi:hypothetical protein